MFLLSRLKRETAMFVYGCWCWQADDKCCGAKHISARDATSKSRYDVRVLFCVRYYEVAHLQYSTFSNENTKLNKNIVWCLVSRTWLC